MRVKGTRKGAAAAAGEGKKETTPEAGLGWALRQFPRTEMRVADIRMWGSKEAGRLSLD